MMKILIPATLLLAACAATDGRTRTITLAIEGGGGRKIYFDRFENNRAVHIDSVTLGPDGGGSMHVPLLPMDFYRVAFNDQDQTILALDSMDEVTVKAKLGRLMTPDQVTGSKASEDLHALYRSSRSLEMQLDSLKDLINSSNGDMATMDRYNQVVQQYAASNKAFIAAHPGSPALLSAVSKLSPQQDMAQFTLVRDQLRKVMASSGFYKAFRDQVDRMEKQQAAMKQQQEQQQKLGNLLPVGAVAPEIRQQTPEGGMFALSEMRGKVVLIDFWASWCRPCRMENPTIVKAYNKYHGRGFDVLGVSLDRDGNAWKNAIQQDGLTWKHVSDLQWWNNAAAQEYGVSSIPFSVLVDKDGKVIDKNLRGPALEAKLAEVLGS